TGAPLIPTTVTTTNTAITAVTTTTATDTTTVATAAANTADHSPHPRGQHYLHRWQTSFTIASTGWPSSSSAVGFSKRKLYKKCEMKGGTETPLPGVSIIKPLVGIDPNLFNNLESFFTMNYS
ncbi:unnamed protein product, partial [Medioppia subpectinata]